MKIGSSSPSSIAALDSSSPQEVDGGQSMLDDVMQILQQLAQQGNQPAGADPAAQGDLVQQLTDGITDLQNSATNGTLSPEVQAQADQLIQALTQAAQAAQTAQNTGYSQQDSFDKPADAAATSGAQRKHHHHHHHAKPVQAPQADANAVAPDPTKS